MSKYRESAVEGALDGALEGAFDGAFVGALDGALDGGALLRLEKIDSAFVSTLVGARVDRGARERCDRREEALDSLSSNLKRGSCVSRAVVTSIPDIAAALGVMNSPSTEVATLWASASATPRRHISTELRQSVSNSIISSICLERSSASNRFWSEDCICLTIL